MAVTPLGVERDRLTTQQGNMGRYPTALSDLTNVKVGEKGLKKVNCISSAIMEPCLDFNIDLDCDALFDVNSDNLSLYCDNLSSPDYLDEASTSLSSPRYDIEDILDLPLDNVFNFDTIPDKIESPLLDTTEDSFVKDEVCDWGIQSPDGSISDDMLKELLDVLDSDPIVETSTTNEDNLTEDVQSKSEESVFNLPDTVFNFDQFESKSEEYPSSDGDCIVFINVDNDAEVPSSPSLICMSPDGQSTIPIAAPGVDILALLNQLYSEQQNVSNYPLSVASSKRKHSATSDEDEPVAKQTIISSDDRATNRRVKNNAASKVSRAKRKARHKDLFAKEIELQKDNAQLRLKIEKMSKEAEVLREALVALLSGKSASQ